MNAVAPAGEHNPPPPSAFMGSQAEEEAIDKRLAHIERIEGRKTRGRKWTGKLGWVLCAVFGCGNVAQSFVTASLFPLKERVHTYTVLRDDGTAQVHKTSWDLPPRKTEELIQATAVRYTVNCNEWSWVHARAQYDYCLALSQNDRKEEHAQWMNRETNPQAPENVYGQDGFVRVIPTGVSRMGPGRNTIRVFYIEVAVARRGAPPRSRRMVAVHDYVPVPELPADLKLSEPMADIQIIRSQVGPDTNPLELNPQLAPQAAAPEPRR